MSLDLIPLTAGRGESSRNTVTIQHSRDFSSNSSRYTAATCNGSKSQMRERFQRCYGSNGSKRGMYGEES